MKNILNLISFMIFALITMISCNKEKENKNVIPSYEHSVIQKFNPDDGYPFILTETEAPFQYAIYQEDEDSLFVYFESVLNGQIGVENPGYFILSLNEESTLLFYGFITETNSNYDTTIFINDPNDPFQEINDTTSDDLMYGFRKIVTDNKNRFDRWVKRKVQHGYLVTQWIDNDGKYHGVAYKS